LLLRRLVYIAIIPEAKAMPVHVKVKDAIIKRIFSVDSQETARGAAKVMIDNDVGAVVVTKGGEYVGIVTEKDILGKVVLADLDSRKVLAEEIMSSPLVTIRADQNIGEAALLMLQKKIRRLLVVDKGKIVGMITEGDLDRATLDTMMLLSGGF